MVSRNPQEGRAVDGRQNEIATLWEKLKVKANERKTTLDHAHQLQTFLADSQDLVSTLSTYVHTSHTRTAHRVHSLTHTHTPSCTHSIQLKWSSETVTVMFSEDLARDVQGAELMVTQHSELKAEIDTKEEKYVIIIMHM